MSDQSGRLSNVSPEMLNSPEALHRKVGLLLYEDRMLLPFKVPQEALLFHHYMEALAAFVSVWVLIGLTPHECFADSHSHCS